MAYSNSKSATFRASLIWLSGLLHEAIEIVCSRDALQPPGIRGIVMGVSLLSLSPFRPMSLAMANDSSNSLEMENGNALTFERVLQRPTPGRLWTTDRPRMRYPLSRSFHPRVNISRCSLSPSELQTPLLIIVMTKSR